MLNEYSAESLVEQLRELDEHPRLEAKSGSQIGASVMQTECTLRSLAASRVLMKLTHQKGLLKQGGAGASTYYQLSVLSSMPLFDVANTSDIEPNTGDFNSNTGDFGSNTSELDVNTDDLPEALQNAIKELSPKARKNVLWPIIIWLCALSPMSADKLAHIIGRQINALKTSHLTQLREKEGYIQYLYPEVINHPEQAYISTESGKQWLKQHTIYSDSNS